MQNSGKYGRLWKNTLLVSVGSAGSKLVGLLMLPFYTRWLSVSVYGTVDLINVYVMLLLGPVTACIADSVFIFPKGRPVEEQKTYFSSGLLFSFFSLILTAFLFWGVRFACRNMDISGVFTQYTFFIYGLLATTFLQRYVQQFARSIDRMIAYSTSGIVLTVCIAAFSFLLVPSRGMYGYVIAIMLANLVAALHTCIFSGAFRYFSFRSAARKPCIDMLRYSAPLIPGGMMWWLVNALNRPVMESFLGMKSVGIFAVAGKFPGMISVIFSIFAVSWQISVLEEYGKEGFEKFYNRILRPITFLLFVLYFIIAASSKLLTILFAAPEFYEAWKYIPVLTLGAVFSNISIMVGSHFAAVRKSRYYFYSNLWGAVAAVAGNLLLIPPFGIHGATGAVLLSFAVMAAVRIFCGRKYVRILSPGAYFTMLFAAAAFLVVILFVRPVMLQIIFSVPLLAIFLYVNKDLKNDLVALCRKIHFR